ncbi:ESPR-type extended signal peptide-containing protein [Acinetobacter sp. ASP199]|uniref:ESPR-type extended signal peptide-containing protein n=1 Tax=unclassified Acinetobacter TaxID=196816 RepID=UPI001F61B8FD|nr:ESPR-type extended signal peptide-containing protein [Acinetobacter sp. ASP199]UNT60105.1 hypothetical protein IHE35_04610 [Acinetobacter sp. ASP199]
MNHIYRIIWNETLGAWVAVAENVKRKGKRSTSKLASTIILSSVAMSLVIPTNAIAITPVVNQGGNPANTNDINDLDVTININAPTVNPVGSIIAAEKGSNGRNGFLRAPKRGDSGGDVSSKGLTIIGEPSEPIYDLKNNTRTVIINYQDSSKGNEIYEYSFVSDLSNETVGEKKIKVYAKKSSDNNPPKCIGTTALVITKDADDNNVYNVPEYDWNFVEGDASEGVSAANVIIPNKTTVKGFAEDGTRQKITLANSTLSSSSQHPAAVFSIVKGGDGGKGGDGQAARSGRKGGDGGDAAATQIISENLYISIKEDAELRDIRENYSRLTNEGSIGIYALSQGGKGGNGGSAQIDIDTKGGAGGQGGNGGNASADVKNTHIVINDHYSTGIAAISVAGNGGKGGNASGVVSQGGKGSTAGLAGNVHVAADEDTLIHINGAFSNGILAQSVGGAGGASGNSVGIVSIGGQGGTGGNAQKASVDSKAQITIKGEQSNAIIVQSIGGGGGNGGKSIGLVGLGSSSGTGGDGDEVSVSNAGFLNVEGDSSHGILAQSIGGGGGNTGLTAGIVSLGGKGKNNDKTSGGGGDANKVTIVNKSAGRIETLGDAAHAIVAQSIGGGGGNAGLAAGLVSFGANGGKGGQGSDVVVSNEGQIYTNFKLDKSLLTVEEKTRLESLDGQEQSVYENELKRKQATLHAGSIGILAQSIGGGGGNGGKAISAGAFVSAAFGGKGGAGGNAGDVLVKNGNTENVPSVISTYANNSNAIKAQSIGGGGGNAGYAVSATGGDGFSISFSMGGEGGSAGTSGDVTVENLSGDIYTEGDRSAAVVAQSIGGAGGEAGLAGSGAGSVGFSLGLSLGGKGGQGGTSGSVTVNNNSVIQTKGADSSAIVAQSIGGDGGMGGAAYSFSGGLYAAAIGLGGEAGQGGASNNTSVLNSADIFTSGASSSAIISQSIGGSGGHAGTAITGALGGFSGGLSIGGESSIGGAAQNASVISRAKKIITEGDNATAIIAQSIGGDGGNGGNAIGVSGSAMAGAGVGVGGTGGQGGTAGKVDVQIGNDTTGIDGIIATLGNNSGAVLAQSIGGSGGNAGYAIGVGVNVNADGGVAAGIALGGQGGKGGNADEVNLISYHKIYTEGDNANALTAQSMGGDGGNGGMALGVAATGSLAGIVNLGGLPSVALSTAVGGKGGTGGVAKLVQLSSHNTVITQGDNSNALLAQSLGGGGGSGGFSGAFSLSASQAGAIAANVGVGGTGGDGGTAGQVIVNSLRDISTSGENSTAISAQSIGGTGGQGGMSLGVSVAASGGSSVNLGASIGGDGGNGATAQSVVVNSNSNISTSGDFSHAILAQSINGNGGNGGNAINGTLAHSRGVSVNASVSVGGEGGGIATFKKEDGTDIKNANGHFVFLQNGQEIYRNLSGHRVDQDGKELDGSGRYIDQNGYQITADGHFILNDGKIVDAEGRERDEKGNYLVAGKRYNDQGFEVTSEGYVVTAQGNVNEVGNRVDAKGNELVENQNVIHIDQSQWRSTDLTTINPINDFEAKRVLTTVDQYEGDWKNYLASILTEKLEREKNLNNVIVNVGKKTATTDSIKNIVTTGSNADAIVAQSIGGNGGTGGLSINGALAFGQSTTNLGVAVGGGGGGGGDGGVAGTVVVENTNTHIHTSGENSSAISAESIGGNGGKGGTSFNLAGASTTVESVSLTASVGGGGGKGNEADDVYVKSNNLHDLEKLNLDISETNPITILTQGDLSHGINAKSIGGGGGQGGFAGNLSLNYSSGATNSLSASVTVGGDGGEGNSAGDVVVESYDNIVTLGKNAVAIKAESIGGGGGSGGNALEIDIDATKGMGIDLGLTLGGDGGKGNTAGEVNVDSNGHIITKGDNSHAVYAKSIGGGGGDGGFAVSGSLSSNEVSLQANITVGGFGGEGNTADTVMVKRTGHISTEGNESVGIYAQSIGGGGGDGGIAISANVAEADAFQVGFSLGGMGGEGASAGNVDVRNKGSISTYGIKSQAIKAQSIGGGGGNGGAAAAFNIKGLSVENNYVLTSAVGGWGGDGGQGNQVIVTNVGDLSTTGHLSQGILAQSIGGGGGDGGSAFAGTLSLPTVQISEKPKSTLALTFALGGFGGDGNTSDEVAVTQIGQITTLGDNASAIQAQSIGGGGGNGGNSETMSVQFDCNDQCKEALESKGVVITPPKMFSASVGGLGGSGNHANSVFVNNNGVIRTQGQASHGIYAQSIGGGGGDGGKSITDRQEQLPYMNGATLSVGIGGYYGSGGNGGDININHIDSIITLGDKSKGIFAQSIGGGGGNGGDVNGSKIGVGGGAFQEELSDLVASIEDKLDFLGIELSDAIKGSAGNGGTVNIKTTIKEDAEKIVFKTTDETEFTLENFIQTQGAFSDAIFAQSVGGGGGIGGTVTGGTPALTYSVTYGEEQQTDENGNVITVPKKHEITLKKASSGLLALGGDGGDGGDGGEVNVSNALDLYTFGHASRGIYAQSIGGGGGAGGDSDGKAFVGIGGAGSMAGKGNTVNVVNTGSIFTQSDLSEGILAQSIGGGGGTGGSVEQAVLALGGGSLTSIINGLGANLENAIGQDGGLVNVKTGSSDKETVIATKGKISSAILAQSIGGGGGIGGSASGLISIGGAGAAAGHGGKVLVNNFSHLLTSGEASSALVAQSIGGGGGVGGSSDAGKEDGESKSAIVSIGGNGSSGGDGDEVNVFNQSVIETTGLASKGILAQSIGGGGGQGGSTAGYDTDEFREKIASIGLGSGVNKILFKPFDLLDTISNKLSGWAAPLINDMLMHGEIAGGNSKLVSVDTGADSVVITRNDASDAIVAQSIAGGGGTSGSSAGLIVAGASSGAFGQAGSAKVTNLGDVFTLGHNSNGIVAQSIGGGGGLTSGIDQIAQFTQLGAEDAQGLASNVDVLNAGNLISIGKLSQAIIAQSIAGGGGVTGLSNQLVLGGSNNTGSDAKEVDVKNTGYIKTTTNGSSAIVAQSIGGGGGFAAGVVNGNVSANNGQGNSANVNITVGTQNAARLEAADTEQTPTGITTMGNYAHGIIAQSIANGGGYTNIIDEDGEVTGYATLSSNDLTGSTSGQIIINQHDSIVATGVGSQGILAQSTGYNAGTIIINNTADALIRGGSADGAAIRIIDGQNNEINNAGILTGSASDNHFGQYLLGQHDLIDIGFLNANAITAGNAEDTINNTGFITGNLNLGHGENALNNTDNGWILSGNSIVVNGLAQNAANWAVSGVNLVGQTDLTGDFTQNQDGTFFWDWNFKSAVSNPNARLGVLATSAPNYDVLNVSGDAIFNGELSINIMDSGYVKPGDFVLDFINAKSVDISALKLDAVASAVAKYNRSVIDGRGAIVAEIDFAQKGLSKNGLSLGEAINQIQLNEVATFRPVAAPLFYRPDLAALQDTYNLLSGEGVVASQQLYFTQNAGVMSDLSTHMDFWRSKSVHDQNGGFATVSCSAENEAGSARTDVKNCLEDNKWSLWLAGHNGEQEQRGKTSSGMANVNSDSYRTMVGLDVAVTPNTLIGVAYSNGKTQYEVQDRLTTGLMDFEGVNIFASHRIQDSYVKALIGYDRVSTEVNRYAFIDPALDPIVQVAGVENNLTGEAKADAYSLRLETGRLFELDGINVTPFIGAQYTQLDSKAFRESARESTDPLALQYEKSSVYSAPLFIGAQFDKNFVFSEGVIQPYARFALSHELSSTREMDASFVSAPGYIFRTQGGEPQRNSFDMNVGFKMTSITNLSIFGQYYGKYASSSSSDQGGSIGLELNW